ncbi:MAG: PAC2 family protein [Chloroflexota bacterium]|nr:PAC2 family protein [Chloroflexota bacterium]
MNRDSPVKILKEEGLQANNLFVAWNFDAGNLGSTVVNYLHDRLGATEFAEFDLLPFFQLSGVSVKGDIVQFPEARFYSCNNDSFLTFRGDGPDRDHYGFLKSILDLVEHCCGVRQIYTVGGIVSLMSHVHPRRISVVVNDAQLKDSLQGYNLETSMYYQTRPGSRPTLSSFLAWAARKRNIGTVNLWVEVPFYLSGVDDPRAGRRMLAFLNDRFGLGVDLSEVDSKVSIQSDKLQELRERQPQIGEYMTMLERGITLSNEENDKLMQEVAEWLKD